MRRSISISGICVIERKLSKGVGCGKNHPERARELARQNARRYREKYPEKAKELRRLDYYKHREKRKQTKKRWYEKNRERELIHMKKWREDHEEYRREWWSKYYEENKEKLLEAHRLYCKKNKVKLSERGKAKRRAMGIPERWSKEHLRKWCLSNRIKPNKAEKKMIRLFENNNLPFKFVGDGQVVIAGKIPDFINYNGGKQIIEFFGDYWHKPEEEEERKKIFAGFGYETLIIWEHELKDEALLLKRIETWIEG